MSKVLFVDDEKDLAWAVRHSLKDEGHEVYTAYDGIEALTAVHQCRPDIIVLDIVMPRLDGLQVCHSLRRDPDLASVPILFLSKRNNLEDRLTAFDEGSDDFLSKPFDLRELKARIRALLRRAPPSADAGVNTGEATTPMIKLGKLELDSTTYQVRIAGRVIQLTTTEFELVRFLMLHPDKVYSSQQLLQQVWGYPPDTADTSLVRWHIKNLRSKIEADPDNPIYIRNLPRHGYILGQCLL